jgi:hypothetical protein
LPKRAYTTLSPATSPFHPSRLGRARVSLSPRHSDGPSDFDDEEEDRVAWYEQADLTSLVVANNEIEHLGEELGAFEDLQILDVSRRKTLEMIASSRTNVTMSAGS